MRKVDDSSVAQNTDDRKVHVKCTKSSFFADNLSIADWLDPKRYIRAMLHLDSWNVTIENP
jgi:hypothetical protein